MRQNTGILYILTYKCASRHSGVQFFDIGTSKSAPRPSVFLTFWVGNVLLATAACNFSTSQLQKVLRTLSFFTFWLGNVLLATAACNFSTSELQKVLWDPKLFSIFTSKSYFSPQRRAIFRHRNFKKCSETLNFLAFSLQNVLLATATCNFSTSQLQKVLRTP